MPAPFFTTNDLDITQLEGLYIKERNPPASVKGVNLSGVGVVGECVRGPVNTVVEITSEQQFKSIFGGRDQTANGTGGAVVGLVWQSLLNKPFGKLFVVRACAAAAVKASFTLETATGGAGTQVLRVDAANPGTWGNGVAVKVSAATDGNANHFNLTVRYLGEDTLYQNLDISATGNDNTLTVLGTDNANLITLTKLADGRPVNSTASTDGADASAFILLGQTAVPSFVGVAGTQGSILDTDFTGTAKGLELLAAASGVGVVFVAERNSTDLYDKIELLAATAVDRVFVIAPLAAATSKATQITDVAAQRSDRIIYTSNYAYTRDSDTGTELLTAPSSWMASILSQTDIDIHPGEEDTKRFTAGITRLYTESYLRQDYIDFKAAGICCLEKNEGFAFVSGVTTLLTTGKTEITRRRMTDFIQLSLAGELKYSVKKKNTTTRRLANAALIQGFLNGLKLDERVVEDFTVDTEKLNTALTRAAGTEKILLRVRLIGHILALVLETEIGTGVTFTELAAA